MVSYGINEGHWGEPHPQRMSRNQGFNEKPYWYSPRPWFILILLASVGIIIPRRTVGMCNTVCILFSCWGWLVSRSKIIVGRETLDGARGAQKPHCSSVGKSVLSSSAYRAWNSRQSSPNLVYRGLFIITYRERIRQNKTTMNRNPVTFPDSTLWDKPNLKFVLFQMEFREYA